MMAYYSRYYSVGDRFISDFFEDERNERDITRYYIIIYTDIIYTRADKREEDGNRENN